MINSFIRFRFSVLALAASSLFLLPVSPAKAQTAEPEIKTRIVADTLNNGKVKFYLACETTEIFTNGGYSLVYEKTREGNVFTISFTAAKAPNKGTRNKDAARQSIALGQLSKGIYTFEFTDKRVGKMSTWKMILEVSESGVSWYSPAEKPK